MRGDSIPWSNPLLFYIRTICDKKVTLWIYSVHWQMVLLSTYLQIKEQCTPLTALTVNLIWIKLISKTGSYSCNFHRHKLRYFEILQFKAYKLPIGNDILPNVFNYFISGNPYPFIHWSLPTRPLLRVLPSPGGKILFSSAWKCAEGLNPLLRRLFYPIHCVLLTKENS